MLTWFRVGGQYTSVIQYEQQIADIACSWRGTFPGTWVALSTSIDGHIASVLQVETVLRTFYTSKLFKIKTMHHKQAKAATLDKGVSRLCKAAGMATKLPTDSPKPLFVVGDGQFGSRGTPIQHQRFIQSLKKKVVGLNGVIAYGDEYLASRVCCQCKTQGEMVGRAIQCPGCNQERDRDHNGATNLARAARSLIDGQGWPVELDRNK